MDQPLANAFEATWPAAEYADTGGFRVGRGFGGGGRVSSARALADWTDAGMDAAIAVQRGWGQRPLFRARDDDTRLTEALLARGLQRENPTLIMAAVIAALDDRPIPPVTAFTVWPAMAIQREIWAEGNISVARQAVMEHAPQPKVSLLGRLEDRAVGAGFVAVHDGVAMLHGLEVLPGWRRKGMGGWLVRRAANWAAGQGAGRLALAVSRANTGAVALYRSLGFQDVVGYAYYAVK